MKLIESTQLDKNFPFKNAKLFVALAVETFVTEFWHPIKKDKKPKEYKEFHEWIHKQMIPKLLREGKLDPKTTGYKKYADMFKDKKNVKQ